MGKNTRNTTARERILKKIRQALLKKRDHPYPQFEDSPLYSEGPGPLPVLFAERFTANDGHFVYCESELQLMENLLALTDQKKFRKIHVWEPVLQDILDHYEFPYLRADRDLTALDVGIITCEALIGREGAVLLSNANAAGRRLSSMAPVLLIFAGVKQIVPDIKDGMSYIQKKYGSMLPSSLSLVNGAGHQQVYVFLLDY